MINWTRSCGNPAGGARRLRQCIILDRNRKHNSTGLPGALDHKQLEPRAIGTGDLVLAWWYAS